MGKFYNACFFRIFMEFKDIVQKRYATKQFNGEEVSEDKIDELLEIIRLSPSSFNVQPWRIKVISDKETKEKLLPVSYNQPQITSCSHLLVFCADTNLVEHVDRLEKAMIESGTPEESAKSRADMIRGSMNSKDKNSALSWAQRQMYIALGNAVNGAKSLGLDSCPMEGFSSEEYSNILDLPENLVPTALVTIGYASDEPPKKVRFSKEEVFF